MIARLAVAEGLDGAAHARWTAATLLDTTAWTWRDAREDDSADAGPVVFVGPPERAPSDVAVILPWVGLAPWAPETLALSTVYGVTMPVPYGLTAPEGSIRALPAPFLRAAYALLTREEERLVAARDQWNCFPATASRLDALGVLDWALVNDMAAAIGLRLEVWADKRGARLEPRPLWPRGAWYAVALTHDVDEVRHGSVRDALRLVGSAHGPRGYAWRAGLTLAARGIAARPGADDPYWQFDRWVEAEETRGLRSSFYFCAPQPGHAHAYDATYRLDDPVRFEGRRVRVRDLMARLVARGFEVGLHGSYDSYADPDLLARERAAIAAASRAPVTGTRQHFLRFDPATTWPAQEAAGFTVDSTLGYNEGLGFRAGIAAPFTPFDVARGRPGALLELPLSVMDGTLFRTLGLDAEAAAARTIALLESVRESHGLATLLWHPNGASAAHYPGWWRAWETVLDWLAGEPAWVTDAGSIATWWRKRTTGEPPAVAG